MCLSNECSDFLKNNLAGSITEEAILKFLTTYFPIKTRLDWLNVIDKLEIPNVSRNKLKPTLIFVVEYYEINLEDVFYILNMNDSFPFLEVRLNDWLDFIDELDFVDTIFVHEHLNFIIHWDFYKQIYAKKIISQL